MGLGLGVRVGSIERHGGLLDLLDLMQRLNEKLSGGIGVADHGSVVRMLNERADLEADVWEQDWI